MHQKPDEVDNITLSFKATPHQSGKLTASPQGEAFHIIISHNKLYHFIFFCQVNI